MMMAAEQLPSIPPTPDRSVAAPLGANEAAAPRAQSGGRVRAGILFSLEGDLRFLSHRDETRMLERALVRAAWPLKHSQGFNPQPRISLPLPRPVGMSSSSELALVDLSRPTAPDVLADSLSRVLPEGCRLLDLIAPATSRAPQPKDALYECELSKGDAATAAHALPALLAAETLVAPRLAGPAKPAASADLRPYLVHASLLDRTFSLRVAFDQQRSARPAEILAALGVDPAPYAARWRRVNVTWNTALAQPTPNEPTTED